MKERTIYLVRHCKPKLRDTSTCIGISDIPLSQKGIEQADKLKRYFSNKNINAIYSSPLSRAKDTAEIIAGNKITVGIRYNFSEINMGKWDGVTFDEIKQKYPEEYIQRGKEFENYVVEGGESMTMCKDRSFAELQKVIANSTGNIIVVAHAGVNRSILSELLGISIKKGFSLQGQYGSISVLKYDGDFLKVDDLEIHI